MTNEQARERGLGFEGDFDSGPRSLSTIAREIREDWSKQKSGVYFGAQPYLGAMFTLDSIEDNYYFDTGVSVVLYFLSNASGWRGETARRVKAELKQMAGVK